MEFKSLTYYRELFIFLRTLRKIDEAVGFEELMFKQNSFFDYSVAKVELNNKNME